MNTLITGGLGFIGLHIVEALLAQTSRRGVIVVDDLSTTSKTQLDKMALIFKGKVVFLNLKLDGSEQATVSLERLMRVMQVDQVVHCAGLKDGAESNRLRQRYYHVNLGANLNVIDATNRNPQIGRVVFSSSASVYAPQSIAVKEFDPLKPATPYAMTKMLGESMFKAGLKTAKFIALRYFNPVGASRPEFGEAWGTSGKSVIWHLCKAADTGEVFTLNSLEDGKDPVRDFIDVRDLARFHVQALEHPFQYRDTVVNLGTGTGVALGDVVQVFHQLVAPVAFTRGKPRTGDIPYSCANVGVMTSLGWKARTPLLYSLKAAYASYRAAAEYTLTNEVAVA